MQVLTKRLMITFLAVILGFGVVACNDKTTTEETPNDSIIPSLSNPDGIFVSNDDYTITYGDLYNEVKINDGLNQLLNLIDAELISEYITEVTPQEIADRMLKLKYGTDDQEEIDKLDADEKADLEKAFEDSMYLIGYGDNMEDYVRLVVARENYAVELMTDIENIDEPWYAGPTLVADYYEANYEYDVNTIKIRFMSESDAKAVLRSFNLVSKAGEMKLYTGTTPLDQVPSSQLNDTNTRSLSDEEILEKFIEIYNYVYDDFRDTVAVDASLEDLKALDDLTVAYETLAEASPSLANFVYESLGTYEAFTTDEDDLMYYTYEPVKYYGNNDTSYYMILNLDREEKVDVTDFDGDEADLVALIGQDVYDEVEQDIIDLNLSSGAFVSNRMADLRAAHDFAIYDYYIGVDYKNVDSEFEIDETGHLTTLATYDDVTITADDLLTFALNNNVELYTIYAIQTKAVIAAHYEDVYCVADETCEFDITKNTSEKMEEHRENYDGLREQFDTSYYAGYYTFEEYLYLAYGVRSDNEMLLEYYVTSTLQPFLIYDEIIKDDYAILDLVLEIAQPYYDHYFSLDVDHLLIYLDRDENGDNDDWGEYYDSLDDTTVFDQKITDFEAAIRTYLDDSDNDMASFVTDYNTAKRDDATWGEFKSFGFLVMTESLGQQTYKDAVATLEMSFVDGLIDLYQAYNTVENENEAYIFSDTLVESSYGVHLIRAEKGTEFDQPSALFTMTYDDDLEPEYLDGLVNTNNQITKEQLKIYTDYRFSVIAYGSGNLEDIYGLTRPDMPEKLLDAFETYVTELLDGLYVVGYLNNIIIDQLHASDYVNSDSTYCSVSQADFLEHIDVISEIYMSQIFQELDHRTND